jgi:hypothetical protein
MAVNVRHGKSIYLKSIKMSREITITAYEFAELEPKVKEKVLDNYRYTLLELNDDWAQPVIEEFNEDMLNFGITADVKFSGFGSQGDGASFTTDTCDTDLLIRKLHESGHKIPENALLDSKDFSVSIYRNGFSYAHEYTTYVDIHGEDTTLSHFERKELEAVITEWSRIKSRELYINLENEFDSLTSDEAIIKYFTETEFLFYHNGTVLVRNID